MGGKNKSQQLPDGIEASRNAGKQLIQALDSLTDAVRELSWIILDGWEWKLVEDPGKQPTSKR